MSVSITLRYNCTKVASPASQDLFLVLGPKWAQRITRSAMAFLTDQPCHILKLW